MASFRQSSLSWISYGISACTSPTDLWTRFARRPANDEHRIKSLPIQEENNLRAVLRYVERNPLRTELVERAEE